MDVNTLCRACLTSMDSVRYILFENVSPDIYWFCTSIEIMKEEQLPKFLCEVCYGLLMQFSEFKSTCIKSQNTLSKQMHTNILKTENIYLTHQSLDAYRNKILESNSREPTSSPLYQEIFNDSKNVTDIVKEEDPDQSTNGNLFF